jgi:RNA polymerase sigma-70 factor (ECF subfamily)
MLGMNIRSLNRSSSLGAAESESDLWRGAALKSFVQRLGRSSADCEDIVQEAYLRLLEFSHRNRPPGSPGGYLLVIARNLVAEAGRRSARDNRRNQMLEVLNTQLAPAVPSPEELAFVDQARQRLARTLRALPPRTRKAFLLHRYRAMKHTEIAARLGVTVRTVERDVAHALSRLKDVLIEGGEIR